MSKKYYLKKDITLIDPGEFVEVKQQIETIAQEYDDGIILEYKFKRVIPKHGPDVLIPVAVFDDYVGEVEE